MPGLTFPATGRLGVTSPPSRSAKKILRPSVLCSAKTAASPSRSRSIFSFLPRYPALPIFSVCVSAFADSPQRRGLLRDAGISPHGRTSSSYLSLSAGRQTALSSSRAVPVNTCPGLRPRRCPGHSPRPGLSACLTYPGLLPSVHLITSAFPPGFPEVYP